VMAAAIFVSAGLRNNTAATVKIFKNGVCIAQSNNTTSGYESNAASVTVVDQANGTDYYECFANIHSSSTSTIGAINFITQFSGGLL